jgi:hypothetical protein
MLPNLTHVYQCPTCDNLLSRGSRISDNTYGVKHYSDAIRVAPMFPDYPQLTICPKCNTIFWLNIRIEVGKYENGENINEKWKDAEQAKLLTIYECFTAMETLNFTQIGAEVFIRLHIWWGFNDRARNGEALFNSETDEKLWLGNINRLLEILDINDDNDLIFMAELHRNLGNFEKCLEILNLVDGTEFNWLKPKYIKECNDKNTKVFQLN